MLSVSNLRLPQPEGPGPARNAVAYVHLQTLDQELSQLSGSLPQVISALETQPQDGPSENICTNSPSTAAHLSVAAIT
jgi:hypothetical protein